MDLQLNNKLALVSGSTAGIGYAIATALVGVGADTAAEDAQGRTPAQVAAAQGHPGLAEALQ